MAERKRIGERYISSALARQAIADGDADTLRSIVPERVFDLIVSESYLKEPCC